ncbi:MAG: hypothetical protein WBW41_07900 [Verrucomicrobiia bacterium]
MKTYFLFVMIGCAMLTHGVGYAGPSNNSAAVPKEKAPDYSHPVPAEQAKPPIKNVRTPGSGTATIGGPANPTKAAPSITGAVNPAKNTAAINGTGMKRKP